MSEELQYLESRNRLLMQCLAYSLDNPYLKEN